MPSTRLPWSTLERNALAAIRPTVPKHLAAARACHSLIRALLLMSASAHPRSGFVARSVQARLLLRLSADLHVVEFAVTRGYMLQALTLGATIHELAFAIGYIGTDDSKATRWEDHSKHHDTFPSLRQRNDAVRATLKTLGFESSRLEEEVERLERNYRFLCMGKHGNPILQRNWGAIVEGDSMSLLHGPFITPDTPKQARQILYTVTELIWYASGVYLLSWQEGATSASQKRAQRHLRRLEGSRWEAQFFPSKPPQRRPTTK